MKKMKLLTCGILGLSMAFGLATFVSVKSSKKAEPVHAATQFFIGTHNLIENATCSGSPYTGSAKLETESGQYVLTLDGFNNNNTVSNFGGALTAGLILIDSPTNITIKVKGNCTISNSSTAVNSAYGAFILANSKTVTIVGEGSNPILNIEGPSITAEGGDSNGLGFSGTGLVISNCTVNLTANKSYNATALYDTGSLTINSGAVVNATAKGTNAGNGSNKSIGIQAKSYVQNAGSVTTSSADSTGKAYSEGMRITNGNLTVSGGTLTATGGKTGGRSSSGIRVDQGKVTLQGGEVVAKANTYTEPGDESNVTSMGIYVGVTPETADTRFVEIKSGLKSLYAHGKDRGINCEVTSKYLGYTSDAEDIYSQTTFGEFEANNKAYVLTKTVLFRKMTFVVATTDEVYYDGSDYNALDIEVSVPASGYTIEYSTDGGETWSTTNPVFSAASDDPYVVNYKITSKLYAPISASVQLIIHKIPSYVTSVPSAASSLVYNGTAQNLVSGGSASGGSLVYSVNGGEYSATPTGINAGTYTVSYKVSGDENHIDTDPVDLGSVTIAKAASTVTSEPTLVSNFAADGKEHNLVVPGTVEGGTFAYSVNGGDFSEDLPKATAEGTYSISYKVIGDDNHNDIEEVSLGSVVVSAPAKKDNKGLSAGGVVGIVLGSLVFVIGAAYLVLLFLLNKWIKVGDKAVRVMRFALGSKDGKERYLSFKFKFEYREKHEVFNTKDEALK